ncbi:MAG: creatininase family protein [Armatimonadetes bacterium]|nr:creatininase family protein [Armatimonadota bacterium]
MSNWNLPIRQGHMDKPDGVYFQNMTGKDIEERLEKDDIILIPIGSTETHGPHAPYGEDTLIASRIAEAVAVRTGCTVAMPAWYGSHPMHHLGMPGTIVMPDDTFIAMVRAIIAGFWNAGFRKQILLNAHGQEYIIPTAIQEFGKRYQVPALIINATWFNVIPTRILDKPHGGPFETPWVHSDEGETSVALNFFPEMIRMENAVDTYPKGVLPAEHIDRPGQGLHRPIPWYAQIGAVGSECICFPEGVVGSATLGDASKISGGIEELLDYLVRLHDDILRVYPPGKLPENMTLRPKEEIEALTKKPFSEGWRPLYTVAYPP